MRLIVGTLALVLGMTGTAFAAADAPHSVATPSAATPTCGGETPLKADGTPWVCTFDDEFDASTGDADALNTSVWTPQLTATSNYRTGPSGNQACYVDSPNNISVADGDLMLTARQEPAPITCNTPGGGSFSTNYTAGMVSTIGAFSQTYGRFDVRAQLPQSDAPPPPTSTCTVWQAFWHLCTPAPTTSTCTWLQQLFNNCPEPTKGLQETLWLWPVNDTKYGPYPSSGEIDFAEFYGNYPDLDVPYIHYVYNTNTVDPSTNTNIVTDTSDCTIDPSAFNTYSVVWEPGTITLSYNDNVCLIDNYQPSTVSSPAPFDQPFFIALTQALGIGTNAFSPSTTPLPATTSIDYVRVWQ